ncbi:MAG: hypothetical protein QNL62_13805 [Gammaproteobacteria bacterium]|nr:hypothetical protein [Gammaproteobacteria bacterium]
MSGCSSDSATSDSATTGSTAAVPANAVVLDATNAESTVASSVTTVDTLDLALAVETAPAMGLLDALALVKPHIETAKNALQNTGSDPVYGVAVSESGACSVSGTFSFTGDEGGTSPSFTDSGNVTLVNCNDGLDFIVNGNISWVESWNNETGKYSETETGSISVEGTDPNNAFKFSFVGLDFAESGNKLVLGAETYTITKATFSVDFVGGGVNGGGFLAGLTAPIVETSGGYGSCPESGTILITGANGSTAEGIYNGDGTTMTIKANGEVVDAAAPCYY